MWLDLRPPYRGLMVLASLLDSLGSPLDSNFLINEDTSSSCSPKPDVGCDRSGNFTVVWCQYVNHLSQVLLRRFRKDGTPVGPAIIVNDLPTYCYYPCVEVTPTWGNIVSWSEKEGDSIYSFLQIFDSQGNPVGKNIKVSERSQIQPIRCDISISAHEFWVVFSVNDSIFGQRFDTLGNKIDTTFLISDDIPGQYPVVVRNHFGEYLISWSTGSRLTKSDVYIRIYDSTASPITPPIKINEPHHNYSSCPRAVCVEDSGWMVVWEDSSSAIYLQQVSRRGTLIGTNKAVSEPIGIKNCEPDISTTGDYIFITWGRRKTYFLWDIVERTFSWNGNPAGGERIVSDDRGGGFQGIPSVVADSAGNFFAVWLDDRDSMASNVECFGRRFNRDGQPLGEDFRIDETGWVSACHITRNRLGLYLVVWTVNDSNSQIYGQRFDRNGTPLGPNFKIGISEGAFWYPLAIPLANDHFVTVWEEDQYIHGRFLDALGIPYGPEFITMIDTAAYHSPGAIIDKENGKFAIAMSCSNESLGIAVQELDYQGNLISPPIIINDEPVKDGWVSGARADSLFLFVWKSGGKIWGQRLNFSLHKIGSNFLISDDTLHGKVFPWVVSHPRFGFFAIWTDERNGNPDLYGQFFDLNANLIGNNFRVDNDSGTGMQDFPRAFSGNDLIYIVWGDSRDLSHWYDAYGKVIEWGIPRVPDVNNSGFSDRVAVCPNPFVDFLDINLPEGAGEIVLSIYDPLGRIIWNKKVRGSVRWSGNSLAAGVYFIELKSSSAKVIRKIIKLNR